MATTKCSLKVEGSVKIYDITWTVANIEQLTADDTREIYSDIAINSPFQLKIKFIGRERKFTEFYYSSRNPVFFINGQISTKELGTMLSDRKYYKTEINMWNHMSSFEGDLLTYVQNKDKLQLIVQLKVTDIKANLHDVATGSPLNTDIDNLLNKEMFCDVTIKSIEGNEYKAHKLVLATQSPILREKLVNNSADCLTNVVDTQLQATLLKDVLTFMYSDQAPRVDEIPEELLAVAEHYQLVHLKSLSEMALQKKLTIDNAIDTLQLAQKYMANELKYSTLKFIKDGRASLITKTEGWAKLDSLEVAKEIYECYLEDSEQKPCTHPKMFSAEMDSVTEGCVKNYTINWAVPNIEELLKYNTTQEILSNVINSVIQLKIQILGRQRSLVEFYYSFYQPVNFSKCQLSILNDKLRYINLNTNIKCNTPKINTWYYLGCLSRSRILSDYCTRYGKIKLKLEIAVTDMKVDCCDTIVAARMGTIFENTLNNELFSDTIIKSADGNEYKVHKLVLLARSLVLKACFEHNTTECHTNIIESPFDSEVLQDVITFMYSDKSPKVDEIPDKLLAAADYYQLGRLKSLCELALKKKLTVDNAIDNLLLAHKYSANVLKNSALEFIKDNATLIIKSDGWTKLDSVDCVKMIYEHYTG